MDERDTVIVSRGRLHDQRDGSWIVAGVGLHGDQRPALITAGVCDQQLSGIARYQPHPRTEVLQRRDDGRQALAGVEHLCTYRQVQLVLLRLVLLRRRSLRRRLALNYVRRQNFFLKK